MAKFKIRVERTESWEVEVEADNYIGAALQARNHVDHVLEFADPSNVEVIAVNMDEPK